MSSCDELVKADPHGDAASRLGERCAPWSESLGEAFGAPFAFFDGATGELLDAGDQPSRDWTLHAELIREVGRRGSVEFLDDEDPLLLLAIGLPHDDDSIVAVGTFVGRAVAADEDLAAAAERLGVGAEELGSWARRQTPWSADVLSRMARLVMQQWRSQRQIGKLQEESGSLSVNLAETYEEISLLYRLTQNLKLSQSDEELGRIALEWMREVVPAAALAFQLLPLAGDDASLNHEVRTEPVLLCDGECPLDGEQFTALIEHLGPETRNRPMVINRPITDGDDWPFGQVRQLIVVALVEGENLFGYLAAVNHVDGEEFGTVEASLLSSVAAILGIHSGNVELYRQQSELLTGVVRALTSAIDAKDPYTCGHSDRVARVAVRLAEELGCDAKTLNTMYLSGLLHDIGKIGISDAVLRKPGKLTDEEYEHIKKHVEIGHRILLDLGRLEDVLPVVLYHHESWDGGGYPSKLGAERIPLAARIAAVADSYDAMSSDRPYRKGMPDEKIDAIFRSGSGQQWDPQVIDAFFRARDDLRQISDEEQESVTIDLPQPT